ncbi:MAG: glucuronosyltransferase [Planctomycetota bacterium]|jgi:UDP-N-acetylglucosamine transferase subunit ALG13|nr:MAG: glucuronosyltransferase [Planctomycetota bacterium]
MDPFDRLLRAVDGWVKNQAISEPVVAQIGNCKYLPQNFPYVRFLTPGEYQAKFAEARFVIAHAGMGTIITAIELRKMLVIMPKLASLGEQRNDHQLATLRHFQHHPQIRAALDEEQLPGVLDEVLVSFSSGHKNASDSGDDVTSPPDLSLVRFVKDFVNNS